MLHRQHFKVTKGDLLGFAQQIDMLYPVRGQSTQTTADDGLVQLDNFQRQPFAENLSRMNDQPQVLDHRIHEIGFEQQLDPFLTQNEVQQEAFHENQFTSDVQNFDTPVFQDNTQCVDRPSNMLECLCCYNSHAGIRLHTTEECFELHTT